MDQTGFVIGLNIFSNENTSERNVLVETNHWEVERTTDTKATLYKAS